MRGPPNPEKHEGENGVVPKLIRQAPKGAIVAKNRRHDSLEKQGIPQKSRKISADPMAPPVRCPPGDSSLR